MQDHKYFICVISVTLHRKSVREEEDGLLERGWEKEEILKLEEGEPRGASHKHSSSSSCGDFRLSIYFIHFCYSERQKIERQRNMRVDIWKPCFILILKKIFIQQNTLVHTCNPTSSVEPKRWKQRNHVQIWI